MPELINGKPVFCVHLVWKGALPICMYNGINNGLAECKDCPNKQYKNEDR